MIGYTNFSIEYLMGDHKNFQEKFLEKKSKNFKEEVLHPALRNVKIYLESRELWLKFYALGTEMIVTKNGRRMFPTLQISITGMDPKRKYSVMVDFECMDNKRYRYSFHQSKWVVAGTEFPSQYHIHGDSPAYGSRWTKQVISFDKIKLTNNQLDQNEHIVVNSMHRYQPRFHVILHTNNSFEENQQSSSAYQKIFTFPETSFMAVTAYQNHRVFASLNSNLNFR